MILETISEGYKTVGSSKDDIKYQQFLNEFIKRKYLLGETSVE